MHSLNVQRADFLLFDAVAAELVTSPRDLDLAVELVDALKDLVGLVFMH